MRVFNIFFSQDDKHVYINFENIFYENGVKTQATNIPSPNPNILVLVKQIFNPSNSTELEEQLNRKYTYSNFVIKREGDTIYKAQPECNHSVYCVPISTHLAYTFFNAISIYIGNSHFDKVLFTDGSYIKGNDSITLTNLDSWADQSLLTAPVIEVITKKMISLTTTPTGYEPLLKSLHAIATFSATENIPFPECFLTKNRFLITYREQLPPVIQQQKLNVHPLVFFQLLIKHLDKFSAHFVLKNISLDAKKALYEPCMGQLSHDKLRYQMNHTEIQFLDEAIFMRLPSGQLAIDSQNNPKYAEVYAPGKENHLIFKEEINFLTHYLKWEIDPLSDYHKKIVFTSTYSQQLIKNGIHCTVPYLKDIIRTKNALLFFGGKKVTETEQSLEQKNDRALYESIRALPFELMSLIMMYKFPEPTKKLALFELQEILHFVIQSCEERQLKTDVCELTL